MSSTHTDSSTYTTNTANSVSKTISNMLAQFASIALLTLAAAAPLQRRGETTFFRDTDSNPILQCGKDYRKLTNDFPLVALSHTVMQGKTDLCGKQIIVHYQGASVTVSVEDQCDSCHNNDDLDLSPGAFRALAGDDWQNIGLLKGVTWEFADGSSGDGGGGDKGGSKEDNNTPAPEPPAPTPTSTWTPEPTSTWTPPPPTTTSTEESTTSTTPSSTETPTSTSTSLSTSSSASSSAASTVTELTPWQAAFASAALAATASNATASSTTASSTTTSASGATIAIHNATATVIHPDAVVSTAANTEGNLGSLSGLVASLGRIIVAGASS